MPAAAVFVAFSAISMGMQMQEAKQARKAQESQMEEQKIEQARLDKELKDKQAVTAMAESFKQRKRAPGVGNPDKYSKGGTLLTSPLGAGGSGGDPSAGGKTLLGA